MPAKSARSKKQPKKKGSAKKTGKMTRKTRKEIRKAVDTLPGLIVEQMQQEQAPAKKQKSISSNQRSRI